MFGTNSPERFAAQIVDLAGRLDFAREQGFPYITEAFSHYLGQLILDRRTKIYAQKSWETGEKVPKGGRKGAEHKNLTFEQIQQRDNAIVDAVAAELRQGRRKMASYRKVAKKLGVGVITVRRAIKK